MNSLDQLYQQLIMDHAKSPLGKTLVPDDGYSAESFQVNPVCGDQVRLRVICQATADAAGSLDQVVWDGRGCSISQASVSLMVELVEGLPIADVVTLEETFMRLMHSQGKGLSDPVAEDALGDAIALAGVSQYPARIKCALLGWMALKDALTKAAAGDDSPAPIPEGWL